MSLVPPVTRSLLRPHLEDVDNKIQPGAVILTWASMNIDGYLHHIHQASALVTVICSLQCFLACMYCLIKQVGTTIRVNKMLSLLAPTQ